MIDQPAPTPSAPPRSPFDIRDPEVSAGLLLLAVVLLTDDDGRRFPLWPEAWGMAPPLNSVLILLFLVFAIRHIARYTRQAVANVRDAA